MSETRTDTEIADVARRLVGILSDRSGHGTASWAIARARVGRELHDALGDALGPADLAPVDLPRRFRTAAEVVNGDPGRLGVALREIGIRLLCYPPDVVEAIGRALLGQDGGQGR